MSKINPKFEQIAPTFYRLANEGTIYQKQDDSMWYGIASDGVEVCFGCFTPSTEAYLAANPTNDKW